MLLEYNPKIIIPEIIVSNLSGVSSHINHLSTGGGASLEYVQGLPLPGVEALE